MIDAIRHRGPDGDGFHLADGVGLGMCRLSIIDLAGGNQPLCDESGEVLVIQNGEIYNYLELRQDLIAAGHHLGTVSDTEVIAHLYEEDPLEFPKRLNGMFAIAVFDRRRRRLTLVRDRLGKKPLFVYRDNEKVVFASEIKALLAGGLVRPHVNTTGVHDFLSFNFVPLPETMFQEVRHVPPGFMLLVEDQVVSERRYWKLQIDRPEAWDDARQAAFSDLLQDSVALRLRSDVPVGIFLSGGVDSSSIAWATSHANRKPVRAFSIGFAGAEYDETGTAGLLSEALGIPLDVVEAAEELLRDLSAVMWHCDQPHGDASFLPMLRLAQKAREHVKVVLTGEGADELLGGYTWHADGPYSSTRPWSSVRERFEANAVFRHEEKVRLYAGELTGLASRDSAALIRQVLDETAAADPVNQTMLVDVAVLLPGNNLVKADRMGMAHGVELRSPFLDYRFVEFAFTIGGAVKIRDGFGKWPLRKAMEERIPKATAWRAKQMFAVPMREWLRDQGRPLLETVINAPAAPLDRWFDRRELRRIVDEHVSGAADHTRKLRAIVALDLWCRRFAGAIGVSD